nr:hypothetical protein [uncultured Fusobacterium sp.]
MRTETKLEKVLEHLRDYPNMASRERAEALKLDLNIVKTYIARLKKKGYVVEENGSYIVLKQLPANKSEFKQDIIKEMIDVYLDDFRELKVINEKVRVGELVIRLLDKL